VVVENNLSKIQLAIAARSVLLNHQMISKRVIPRSSTTLSERFKQVTLQLLVVFVCPSLSTLIWK
jgi:hypothetical protein